MNNKKNKIPKERFVNYNMSTIFSEQDISRIMSQTGASLDELTSSFTEAVNAAIATEKRRRAEAEAAARKKAEELARKKAEERLEKERQEALAKKQAEEAAQSKATDKGASKEEVFSTLMNLITDFLNNYYAGEDGAKIPYFTKEEKAELFKELDKQMNDVMFILNLINSSSKDALNNAANKNIDKHNMVCIPSFWRLFF